MHRCYIDDEFKPPCSASARWAFITPQMSMLTVCIQEFKQGRCENFLHFQRQLPTPTEAHSPVALSEAVNLPTAGDGPATITLMHSINILWGRAPTATFYCILLP